MKKIENRIIVGEVMAKSLVSCFFLTHGVQIQSRKTMQVYTSSKRSKASDMQKHLQKLQIVEYSGVVKTRPTSQ